MDLLTSLLERKNLCFRSFLKLCEDFRDLIRQGQAEQGLEEFQRRRQALVKVLEQLEKEAAPLLQASIASLSSQQKQLLLEKNGVVQAILDLDLEIMTHIQRLKDETIQKLQSLQSGKRTIQAYKSPLEQVESVETNKALDREA